MTPMERRIQRALRDAGLDLNPRYNPLTRTLVFSEALDAREVERFVNHLEYLGSLNERHEDERRERHPVAPEQLALFDASQY